MCLKHKSFWCLLVLLLGLNFIISCSKSKVSVLQVPGANQYTKIDTTGISVLPNGRYITPAGKTARITHDPFGLALSPDGAKAVVLHSGVLTIVDTKNPIDNIRIPSYDDKIPSPFENEASFLGVAISPDNEIAYLSGGDNGNVLVFNLNTLRKEDEINLNGNVGGKKYQDSFTSDLVLCKNGKTLYVLDRANYRMVTIDVQSRKLIGSVDVGRLPFGISLSKDGTKAFVANVGLYEYPKAPGMTKDNMQETMLEYPPYGIPSKEAEEGTVIDGKKIPGLGSALVPEAMSVWIMDVEKQTVISKLKTGHQIGELIDDLEVVGGASPNSIAVGSKYAFVSNATNDNIAVIDIKTGQMVDDFDIKVDPAIDKWRGLMPFGLTLSNDEKSLYVALLTLNAVAVIDAESFETRGFIPTGWCPSKIEISDDDKMLYVITARGHGAGPNGGKDFVKPARGTYIGDIQMGTFHSIDIPNEEKLTEYTQQVINNTFRKVKVVDDGKNPLPAKIGLRKSPINYVVYVTKENRTYDEVFGEFEGGIGDPTLARYGKHANIPNPDGGFVEDVNVMPNHQKIANEWAISDNFYCDSDASVHGHRWMIGTIPNEWMEANTSVKRTLDPFSPAPGRRFPDSYGGMDPEDYNEIGGLWEQMYRYDISFRNFGQGTEFGGVYEEWNYTNTGIKMPIIYPMAKAVYDRTSWTYAGYNMGVPDQYRMDEFEREISEKFLSGKEPFPQFIAIQVPNDHGTRPHPERGFPYRESYMADNDLALGRLLHFLSRTPQWKEMLVIIVEDDPQGGVDHLDAHRSLLMMVGPYVKRGYTSHTHANFGAVLRTIYQIFDLPPVNQFDATGSLLQDFFTDMPDFSPYTLLPVDERIFKPQEAMDVYDKSFDWRRIVDGPKLDNTHEQREDHYKQNPSNN